MSNNHFTARLKKVKGKLVHESSGSEALYELYKKQLPEGAIVDLYVEEVAEDGSLGQIAKIHAMIRELSMHSGNTFEEMKLEVKKRAGLVTERKNEPLMVKSFGKCSYEELCLSIQAAIEIGELTGYLVG